MRLVVVTFDMDQESAVLAWQSSVVHELAKRVGFIGVLTEHVGAHDLPSNVEVVALSRRPLGVPLRLGGWAIESLRLRNVLRRWEPDAVFVHMAHQWTYRLYPLVRGVPILVWYAHGTVRPSLRVTHRLANRIVTSTPGGFRIPSSKVSVIGQGIDTDLFRPSSTFDRTNRMVYVGRLSRRKRVRLVIEVLDELRRLTGEDIGLDLVGPALTRDDQQYITELKTMIHDRDLADSVVFHGPVPQTTVRDFHHRAFVHVNLSQTGSMDKTVMEALACGCPVVTSNPELRSILAEFPHLFVTDTQPTTVAHRILEVRSQPERYPPSALRRLVLGTHDIGTYADRVEAELARLITPTSSGTVTN